MARQTGFITFSGKFGNMIGYCRNGAYFIRTVPAKVRQTPDTRRAACRFGIASSYGRLIRQAITAYLSIPYDGSLVNRLNKKLISIETATPAMLPGFSFSAHASMQQYFTTPPLLIKEGAIHIPVQPLQLAKGITHLRLSLITTRINFVTRQIVTSQTLVHTIAGNIPFGGLHLNIKLPGKGTLICTLQIEAIAGTSLKKHKKATVADVIAVWPPQAPPPSPVRPSLLQKSYPRITRLLPYRHPHSKPAAHQPVIRPAGIRKPSSLPNSS